MVNVNICNKKEYGEIGGDGGGYKSVNIIMRE